MVNDNYLKNKIDEVGNLYEYDLLKDFLQNDYREDDYLYSFYSSCIQNIERTNLPNCVYKLLWEWTNQNKKKCPDLMNSFDTYMNEIVYDMTNNDAMMKKELEKYKKIIGNKIQKPSSQLVLYFMRNYEMREVMHRKMKLIMEKMIELSKWTDTIGNFILLPQTKRGKRGENVYKNGTAKDRMDVYLYNLEKFFVDQSDGINAPKAFVEYINSNYLWDYVNKKYEVIPLFQTNNKFEEILPNDPEEYITFADNIIKNIQYRGMFMEIMIRLSIESQEIFEEVKETRNANNYAEVIAEIEKIREIKKINLSKKLKDLIMSFRC
ncbi:DUF6994 family protein [Clostridium butyricum]|uniref:DUF6994 family protein n=1 Tax=Clostridium butyricum TaxID=1492 RepID=UPI0035690474